MAGTLGILTPPKTPRKKYNLGSDVDKDEVFDFPFIVNDETVSYIQKNGKVMFLIRGPPSTGKATLSEMLQNKYPTAAFCCADMFFKKSFDPPERSRESIKQSHADCLKNAIKACTKESTTVIVQNTHMRKWEIQCYIDLAAKHHYSVIMAITLYRFNVTPEALYANSPDGLNLKYFQNRLKQWEHILPLLTGWFISPTDSFLLKALAFDALEELLHDGKFCRVYNFFDIDQIVECFKFRHVLCCLAGYSKSQHQMQKYYLGDEVQEYYGKCFSLTILGYYVSPTMVNIIVRTDDIMKSLLLEEKPLGRFDINRCMEQLGISGNVDYHFKVDTYKPNRPVQSTKDSVLEDLDHKATNAMATSSKDTTITFDEWLANESDIHPSDISFIHLGQRDDEPRVDIGDIRNKFLDAVKDEGTITSDCYSELENETKVLRLKNDDWIVKAKQKVTVKALFTGLYI